MIQLADDRREGLGEPLEDVEVRGHIIDSLILPKILDCISAHGGTFRIKEITIGQARSDPSYALIEVRAETDAALRARSWPQIADHGAVPTTTAIAASWRPTSTAPFPRASTARPTSGPRYGWAGKWVPVEDQEMDCGIVVDPGTTSRGRCPPPVASS